MTLLRSIRVAELPRYRYNPIDSETLAATRTIIDAVRDRGAAAIREYGEHFGEVAADAPLLIPREELVAAAASIPAEEQELLKRTAESIARFADAQRRSIREINIPIAGGHAGTKIRPVDVAGCYAPGGRYPLPSSVLMTVVAAKSAGVRQIWVASPKPVPSVLAAAGIAGADGVIPVGGAHAIAAMAFGADPVPRCDMIVGPGNRWVTAAKQLLYGTVGIDMLAGPSELVVIADEASDAGLVAADLLAQAEHDPDALPILISLSERLSSQVRIELREQLKNLPTAEIAAKALENGYLVTAANFEEAIEGANILAPEHLQLHVRWEEPQIHRLRHYGSLFINEHTAEVLGDYGAGPNHVLPTSGTARFASGLSVITFLRSQTWIEISNPQISGPMVADAAALGDLEGLAAHARAARLRLTT